VTKSFTTAIKEHSEEEEEDEGRLEFDLDGETLVAYKPTEEQFALLMQATSRYNSMADAVAGGLDFFHAVLEPDSAAHIRVRLFDRNDDFGIEEVEQIIEWMVEEWTGRPTVRRSGATRSPRSTGPASSRGTRKSTSSASRRASSAT
jgi:hypothetical protein